MINKNITEKELQEIYQADIAIEKQQGHDEQESKQHAQALSYGVFRNLFTYESVLNVIVNKARKVFTK